MSSPKPYKLSTLMLIAAYTQAHTPPENPLLAEDKRIELRELHELAELVESEVKVEDVEELIENT